MSFSFPDHAFSPLLITSLIAGLLVTSACGEEDSSTTEQESDPITRSYRPWRPDDGVNYEMWQQGTGVPCSLEVIGTKAYCEAGSTCLEEYRYDDDPQELEEGRCVEYQSGKYQPFLGGNGASCTTGYIGTKHNCMNADSCEREESVDPDNLVIGVCIPRQ